MSIPDPVETVKGLLEIVNKEIASVNQKYQECRELLAKEREALRKEAGENIRLRGTIAKLQGSTTGLEHRLDTSIVAQLDRMLKESRQEAFRLEQEVKRLKEVTPDYHATLKDRDDTIRRLERQVESLKGDRHVYMLRAEALGTSFDEASKRVVRLANQVKNLKHDVGELTTQRDYHKKQCESMQQVALGIQGALNQERMERGAAVAQERDRCAAAVRERWNTFYPDNDSVEGMVANILQDIEKKVEYVKTPDVKPGMPVLMCAKCKCVYDALRPGKCFNCGGDKFLDAIVVSAPGGDDNGGLFL